jgi:hypothetical protein
MIGKISMQSHVDELRSAVETLVSTEGVEPSGLFVLTNSEGAIHALNYQLQVEQNRFKGLILTGAPGRSVGELARSQILAQVSPFPEEDTMMKHYDEAISAFVKGNEIRPDPSLPDGMKKLLMGLVNPANLPFSRELWRYNVSDSIAKVSEPTLVLIGKKDIQVDWRVDGSALEAAVSRKGNVTFVYLEDADHVLKYEERPLESLLAEAGLNYNTEGRKLDQETLMTILEWLKRHRND